MKQLQKRVKYLMSELIWVNKFILVGLQGTDKGFVSAGSFLHTKTKYPLVGEKKKKKSLLLLQVPGP